MTGRPKIIQIAACDAENSPAQLFALDEEGTIWLLENPSVESNWQQWAVIELPRLGE